MKAATPKAGGKKSPGGKPPAAKAAKKEGDADGFFASLNHPLKDDIAMARAIILGADNSIGEGVKWNSLSYKTADYFATVNLRSMDAVQFVFHRGAKSKSGERAMAVQDPKGLMTWLSSDRCLVTVGKGPEIAANRKAFEAIVRAWIRQL